jgi:transcriptional regulator with XRE-family HTH domain
MLARMEPRRKRLERPHPLKLWREVMGKSQADVAEACQISQPFISYIEAGWRIPLNDALSRLCDYTGLPAEAFVLPERFLRDQPNFLEKYRRRGRPRTRPPETRPTESPPDP